MSRPGPPSHLPIQGKPKRKFPDIYPWSPDSQALTTEELQKGVVAATIVKNEYASCGGPNLMVPLLKHWTAVPALSYFMASAMRARETSRRITSPSTFKPPPRVTLSDQKRESWLKDLSDPRIPLRKLGRTIPHGLWNGRLLDEVSANKVPISRAIWFVRCVGTNELRTLKRKTAGTEPAAATESNWLRMWTEEVLSYLEHHIDSFEPSKLSEWQEITAYMSRLLAHLYYEDLVDCSLVLNWLIDAMQKQNNQWLPVLLLLIDTFWDPLTQPPLIQRLVQAFASRYDLLGDLPASSTRKLDLQFLRLFQACPEAFIIPSRWLDMEKYLSRIVPSQSLEAVRKRNQVFMALGNSEVPIEWVAPLAAIRLLDSYCLPLRLTDLATELRSRLSSTSELVSVVLQWAVYQGSPQALSLGVALCRLFRAQGAVQDALVAFVLESKPEWNPSVLVGLITEFYKVKLFSVESYLRRLMGSGVLHSDDPAQRAYQLHILGNMPLSLMPKPLQAQVRMLTRGRVQNDAAIVAPLIEAVAEAFVAPSPRAPLVADLSKNQQILYVQGVLQAALEPRQDAVGAMTREQAAIGFAIFAENSDIVATSRLWRMLWASTADRDVAWLCVSELQQHVFEFSCAGVLDQVVETLLERGKQLYSLMSAEELQPVLVALQEGVTSPGLASRLDLHIRAVSDLPHSMSPDNEDASTVRGQINDALNRKYVGALVDLREQAPETLLELMTKYLSETSIDDTLEGLGNVDILCRYVAEAVVSLSELQAMLLPRLYHLFFTVAFGPASLLLLDSAAIEALQEKRREYASTITLAGLLSAKPSESSPSWNRAAVNCISHAVSVYGVQIVGPECSVHERALAAKIFKAGLGIDISPAQDSSEDSSEGSEASENTTREGVSRLMRACNVFTFRFCQQALPLLASGLPAAKFAKLILEIVRDNQAAAECAQSLFQQLSNDNKVAVLVAAKKEFLVHPIDSPILLGLTQLVDAVAAAVGSAGAAAGAAVCESDLTTVVDVIVEACQATSVMPRELGLSIQLLVKFAVLHQRSLGDLSLSHCRVVSGLLQIQQMPSVQGSSSTAQLVSDALYILHHENSQDPLPKGAQPAPLDGLMLYSRSNDSYSSLNVWPFDLIEEGTSTISINDLALDLARFETYVEIQDPS